MLKDITKVREKGALYGYYGGMEWIEQITHKDWMLKNLIKVFH